MDKKPLRELRKDSGAKACQVSRDTGIAASRLSAVENGYIKLSQEEEHRVHQFLMRSAKETQRRAARAQAILQGGAVLPTSGSTPKDVKEHRSRSPKRPTPGSKPGADRSENMLCKNTLVPTRTALQAAALQGR